MRYVTNIDRCTDFVPVVNFLKMEFVLIFCGVFSTIFSADLPSYIKPCCLRDPNINECIKNEANAVIPTIVKGDPQLGLPVLSPLVLPRVDMGGSNLQIRLTNFWTDDLKKIRFKEALFDLTKLKAGFVGFIDTITILATYSIQNGKIRSYTVSGFGGFNTTLVGSIIDYKCDVGAFEKNGEQYLQTLEPAVDTKIERVYYKFENFQSSPDCSVDELIDKNWRWLSEELKLSLNRFFTKLLDSTINCVFSQVPRNKLFSLYR